MNFHSSDYLMIFHTSDFLMNFHTSDYLMILKQAHTKHTKQHKPN